MIKIKAINNTYYPGTKLMLHSVIQDTKAKFQGNNSFVLYFYHISI